MATEAKLIHFLQQELALSAEEIKLAVRHPDVAPSQLPMILWQYGLITIRQLEQIFDWLNTASRREEKASTPLKTQNLCALTGIHKKSRGQAPASN